MVLSKLLADMEHELYTPSGTAADKTTEESIDISAVVSDDRKLSQGCMFICIKGTNHDGHTSAGVAAEAGVSVIVAESEVNVPADSGCLIVRVKDTRRAQALISAAWFGYPARSLTTIGLTGTKGKTTTTYMVREMLTKAGRKVGLIGTIEVIIGEEHIHAGNTTPESYLLQEYLRRMVDAGLDTVVMEVYSQALMLHRTDGITYDIGVFTNIEPDHIGPGEHSDFEDYLHCKSLLFRQCRLGVINMDDSHAEEVLKGHTCQVRGYGLAPGRDVRAVNLAYMHKPGELGVIFDVESPQEQLSGLHIEVPTPGRFSVYNALCAVTIAGELGIPGETIAASLRDVRVKGRIEMIPVSEDFTLMLDYAHNAMALKSLLSTLRDYHPARLICLFGCGGNRSRDRRFEMGEVSGRLSDLTIITSDNPRFEEPEAIRYAIEHGERGDIIVLAGKGHEDYQEIKGVKYPMDERDLIRDILAEGTVPGSAARND